MSRSSFEKTVNDLLIAIELSFKNMLPNPALILIFSAIDTLGWLDRPESQKYATRTTFTSWVDNYLLPNSNLNCDSKDLYAARCGLLHTGSAESRLSHDLEAKEIWYAFGKMDNGFLQEAIEAIGRKDKAVALHADELFSSLKKAIAQFFDSLAKDHERANIVYTRSSKLLSKLQSPYFPKKK